MDIKDKAKLISSLGNTIITASLAAEGAIFDVWRATPEIGGNPETSKASWVIRTEMFFFYLHLMDRFVWQKGGQETADIILAPVSLFVLESVEVASWEAPETGEKEGLRKRMIEELIEDFNNAIEEYGTVNQLMADRESGGTCYNDKTIFGKLCARISKDLGLQHSYDFRLMILTVATDILVKSGLKKHVEQVCEALGQKQ